MIIALPSLAFVNVLIHRELTSQNVSGISYVVTSIPDICYFNMLLNMHPEGSVLRKVKELKINDFTMIAHSQSRASEAVDFPHRFSGLKILNLDIVIDDLYHGL